MLHDNCIYCTVIWINLKLFWYIVLDFSTYKKFLCILGRCIVGEDAACLKMLTNFGIFWQSRDLQCLDKLADRCADPGQSKYRHRVSGQQEGSGTGEGGHLPWGQQIRPGKRFVYLPPTSAPPQTHTLAFNQTKLSLQ